MQSLLLFVWNLRWQLLPSKELYACDHKATQRFVLSGRVELPWQSEDLPCVPHSTHLVETILLYRKEPTQKTTRGNNRESPTPCEQLHVCDHDVDGKKLENSCIDLALNTAVFFYHFWRAPSCYSASSSNWSPQTARASRKVLYGSNRLHILHVFICPLPSPHHLSTPLHPLMFISGLTVLKLLLFQSTKESAHCIRL